MGHVALCPGRATRSSTCLRSQPGWQMRSARRAKEHQAKLWRSRRDPARRDRPRPLKWRTSNRGRTSLRSRWDESLIASDKSLAADRFSF